MKGGSISVLLQTAATSLWQGPLGSEPMPDLAGLRRGGSFDLLVDDPAIELRLEKMPPLGRADRSLLAERRLVAAFPQAERRGRLKLAADEELLLALPNRLPVAGAVLDLPGLRQVAALPLEVADLGPALLAAQGQTPGRWCLVALLLPGGVIRQIVSRDGRLFFTRATLHPDPALHLENELRGSLNYLLRHLADETVTGYVIGPTMTNDVMLDRHRLRWLSPSQAAGLLHLPAATDALELLAAWYRRRGQPLLPLPNAAERFRTLAARRDRWLRGAAAAVMAVALASSLLYGWQAALAARAAQQIHEELVRLQEEEAALLQVALPLPRAVAQQYLHLRSLQQTTPSPWPWLASAARATAPDLLQRLTWQADPAASLTLVMASTTQDPLPDLRADLPGLTISRNGNLISIGDRP